MRLRHAAAAAFGALALTVTLSASAYAADGEFGYTYIGLDGKPATAKLIDPPSRECVTLPEVADPDASEPAFSPDNRTTSTVVVFTGEDCDGAYYTLKPGGKASERLKLRSAVFS